MKRLNEWRILLFGFFTGVVIAVLTILQLTSDESDSELIQLDTEADGLAGEIDGLESELDGLDDELLTDEESAEFWGEL